MAPDPAPGLTTMATPVPSAEGARSLQVRWGATAAGDLEATGHTKRVATPMATPAQQALGPWHGAAPAAERQPRSGAPSASPTPTCSWAAPVAAAVAAAGQPSGRAGTPAMTARSAARRKKRPPIPCASDRTRRGGGPAGMGNGTDEHRTAGRPGRLREPVRCWP